LHFVRTRAAASVDASARLQPDLTLALLAIPSASLPVDTTPGFRPERKRSAEVLRRSQCSTSRRVAEGRLWHLGVPRGGVGDPKQHSLTVCCGAGCRRHARHRRDGCGRRARPRFRCAVVSHLRACAWDLHGCRDHGYRLAVLGVERAAACSTSAGELSSERSSGCLPGSSRPPRSRARAWSRRSR
jgi:hypothetical protein